MRTTPSVIAGPAIVCTVVRPDGDLCRRPVQRSQRQDDGDRDRP